MRIFVCWGVPNWLRRHAVFDQQIELKDLPGGRCLSLVHKGPYSELGPTYERLLTAVKERSLEIVMPTREIYLKGPGMIFRGNPKNYLTEVQFLVREGAS